MHCLILAAGYATRLYPLTENFPKPLLPVGGKPILDWLVDDLAENTDVGGFIVVTNHRFASHFEAWKQSKRMPRPYAMTILDDGTLTSETRLGAVRDMELALKRLHLTDDLLVMAGDNMLDFSLAGFVAFAQSKHASCVMCHEEPELKRQQKTAIITVDAQQRITSYEEKPRMPKGNLAVPPFYFYRNKDVNRISEALADGCGEDAPGSFASWLSVQTEMFAYEMPGRRYDVGDLEGYERVKRLFSDGGK